MRRVLTSAASPLPTSAPWTASSGPVAVPLPWLPPWRLLRCGVPRSASFSVDRESADGARSAQSDNTATESVRKWPHLQARRQDRSRHFFSRRQHPTRTDWRPVDRPPVQREVRRKFDGTRRPGILPVVGDAESRVWAAIGTGRIDDLKRVLTEVSPLVLRLETNGRILKELARAGDTEAMEKHFLRMPQQSIVTFSIVIMHLVKRRRLLRVAEYFNRLVRGDVRVPSGQLLAFVLGHFASHPGQAGQERVLELVQRSGYRPDQADIRRLGDQIRYIVGVNAQERYVALLDSLGVAPNLHVFNMLITAAARARDAKRAMHHFGQLRSSGIEPTADTYNSLIECCKRAGDFDRCFELEQQMRDAGVELTESSFAALMGAASYARRADRVRSLLHEYLGQRDQPRPVRIFNAAIHASVHVGDHGFVRQCLDEMRARSVEPTVGTAASLGSGLGLRARFAADGQRLFAMLGVDRLHNFSDEERHRVLTPDENNVLDEVAAKIAMGPPRSRWGDDGR